MEPARVHAAVNYERPEAALIALRTSRYPARTLGERIRRLEMGLTQVELASLLGVHEMTIVNWETGQTKPRGEGHLGLVKSFLQGMLPRHPSAIRGRSKASS